MLLHFVERQPASYMLLLQVQPHRHQFEGWLRAVPALHYTHQRTGAGRLHSSKASAD
jgi:hypothetical protein